MRRKSTKTKGGGVGGSSGGEKPRLFDELQQYDSHSHSRKEKQKHKDKYMTANTTAGGGAGGNKHNNKYICHEYKELR